MKTAKEWFNCLRPDLRDRAIKALKKYPHPEYKKYRRFESFSSALNIAFWWHEEEGKFAGDSTLWESVYREAKDIEEGRKPDIEPKLKGHDKLEELFTKYTSKNWKEFTSYLRENGIRLMYVIHNESNLIEANKELKTWREAGYP